MKSVALSVKLRVWWKSYTALQTPVAVTPSQGLSRLHREERTLMFKLQHKPHTHKAQLPATLLYYPINLVREFFFCLQQNMMECSIWGNVSTQTTDTGVSLCVRTHTLSTLTTGAVVCHCLSLDYRCCKYMYESSNWPNLDRCACTCPIHTQSQVTMTPHHTHKGLPSQPNKGLPSQPGIQRI